MIKFFNNIFISFPFLFQQHCLFLFFIILSSFIINLCFQLDSFKRRKYKQKLRPITFNLHYIPKLQTTRLLKIQVYYECVYTLYLIRSKLIFLTKIKRLIREPPNNNSSLALIFKIFLTKCHKIFIIL